ncbi:Sel1 repeat-containing protein [Sphingomonas sp. PP-CC-3G-468]|nr:Sel1 repeat-containing protein [Sphingomonas sp. PP-CC-3G-468]
MIGRPLALVVSCAFGLGACATLPKSCPALPSFSKATHLSSVAELQCGADLGIQNDQLALAKRYEAGEGVPRDIKRAIALYELASTSVQPNTAIYSPPVKAGGNGQMLFLSNSIVGPGSAEAQYRLGQLLIEGRDVPQNFKRGRSLVERAAKQGYAPAMAALNRLGN